LRRCLIRCRHCRIFFLTHPRNAGRHDLRCPFGCREAHGKQQSNQRSAAHHREHKEKKRVLNAKRSARRVQGVATVGPKVSPAKKKSINANSVIIEYVRMIISLIEARKVDRGQVLEILEKVVRQHSIGRRRKIDHAVAWLNEEPP
jgi:hypothetical protein